MALISFVQPPDQLASGFLEFAKLVNSKFEEKGSGLTEEELTELFNNSFSGRIRAQYLVWINDINDIIDGINIILSDLNDLKLNNEIFKHDPIKRSGLMFQLFLGEFFRIREVSSAFIKVLYGNKVLTKKGKEAVKDLYFTSFDFMYKVRNDFIHNGLKLKEELDSPWDAKGDYNGKSEISLRCDLFIRVIEEAMDLFHHFQKILNDFLSDLILAYEKEAVTITILDESET